MLLQRYTAAAIAAIFVAANAAPAMAITPKRAAPLASTAMIAKGTISGHRAVIISRNGIAKIISADHRHIELRHVPFGLPLTMGRTGALDDASVKTLVQSVDSRKTGAFVPGTINVIFADGVGPATDVATFTHSASQTALAPAYTSDSRINAAFAKMRVDRIERIGRSISRSSLAGMHSRAASYDKYALNVANAFKIHVTGEPVTQAVRDLRKLSTIAFVEPDWIVSTANVRMQPLQATATMPAARRAGGQQWARFTSARPMSASRASLPTNWGIGTSFQSFLNAPGVDAVAAYDEIERVYGQVPGQGEIITNVSIGDVCTNPSYGVSSHVIGGQHYLDVPSLPLIPEYVVDSDANISGSAEACGMDPSLGEILLDFSVMAPQPDGSQRAGETGSGLTDMLGIAPGASYRLVVPQSSTDSAALISAFLAAANQTPAPNVITASIGFGMDAYGFPSRYLDEDALVRSAISTIVNADNIVVCIAGGDGLRQYTNAAVNPMGGSVPTNLTTDPTQVTSLNDVASSTVPSFVMDTGAIDVGGTTTDDIFAANPLDPANTQYTNQTAFPEVRWDGVGGFSSGFGSRVNISAPSDNIPAMSLTGAGYDQVQVGLTGGTSASAPEVAAAAAIMLQVARLSGHPFTKATDVRAALVASANPVPSVPQADMTINVGPQLDVRRGVEALMTNAGVTLTPAVDRVAIAQRQLYTGASYCVGSDNFQVPFAQDFVEYTDPTYIRLDGLNGCGQVANRNLNSPIMIAPDWQGMPSNVRYRLYVTGHPNQPISTNPYQRVYPAQLFKAAGLAATSTQNRTVSLTYDAMSGFHIAASVTFTLTFGPTPSTTLIAPAPLVAAVIDSTKVKACVAYAGNCFSVSYDISQVPSANVQMPVIEVSNPGRTDVVSGPNYYPIWTSPVLTQKTGTIEVPVSQLGGSGIYGISVNLWPDPTAASSFYGFQSYSLPAFTRVVAGSSTRPAAPLLSNPGDIAAGIAPTHGLTIAHGGSFVVSYDVSSVSGATGAELEFSAPGPNFYGNYDTFNNPNGSVQDNNGHDTGSTAVLQEGVTGTVTLTDAQAHLVEGMNQVVRVIPVAGTQAVGEASDVSSISEVGIPTPDGNSLVGGFAINTSGDDGVFTSTGPLLTATTTGSTIGIFSQSTGQTSIMNLVCVGDPFSLLGYVGSDTIVFQQGSVTPTQAVLGSQCPYQNTANPAGLVSSPVSPFSWTYYGLGSGYPYVYPSSSLPDPSWSIVEAGQNASTGISAILAAQPVPGYYGTASNYGVYSSNVGANTSTAFQALNPPTYALNGLYPAAAYIDYNPSTNTAYVMLTASSFNWWTFTQSADDVLATVNFTTNSVSYQDLGDVGAVFDFVIDPVTSKAAVTSLDSTTNAGDLYVIDLSSFAATKVNIASGYIANGQQATMMSKLAVDPTNGLFAVQNVYPWADATDNNPLSEIDIIDESGNLKSSTPRDYNLASFTLGDHWFQLNPTTRTGFVDSADFTQIIPVKY